MSGVLVGQCRSLRAAFWVTIRLQTPEMSDLKRLRTNFRIFCSFQLRSLAWSWASPFQGWDYIGVLNGIGSILLTWGQAIDRNHKLVAVLLKQPAQRVTKSSSRTQPRVNGEDWSIHHQQLFTRGWESSAPVQWIWSTGFCFTIWVTGEVAGLEVFLSKSVKATITLPALQRAEPFRTIKRKHQQLTEQQETKWWAINRRSAAQRSAAKYFEMGHT